MLYAVAVPGKTSREGSGGGEGQKNGKTCVENVNANASIKPKTAET